MEVQRPPLGHDAETSMLLDNLSEALSSICKPGRQMRGLVLVLVDESGVPSMLVNASGRYLHITIGALVEAQFTLAATLLR